MRSKSDILKSPLQEYVLVATYFAIGNRGKSFKIIKRGLGLGDLKERNLAELFLHLSLLLGFPSMLEGLAMLRSATGYSDTTQGPSVNDRTSLRRGTNLLKRVYGRSYARLLDNLKLLHHDLPILITRDVYGRIIARPGLSLKEREIVNIAVLSTQKLNQQLYSHIRGALRVGVSASTARAAIRLSSRIAGVDPVASLQMVSKLNASRKSAA